MKIDPIISDYIDKAVERSRISFKKENDHHLGALKEFFEDKMKALTEYCSSFPTREEVRSIVREEVRHEIKPLDTKITLITDEIIEHRRTLYKHDKRLTKMETKLENVLV